MKITRLGLASLVLSLGATLAGAETLEGVWRLSGTPVELRFAPCDDAVCGLIETSARIQARSPAVGGRSLEGQGLSSGLRRDLWRDGDAGGRQYA